MSDDEPIDFSDAGMFPAPKHTRCSDPLELAPSKPQPLWCDPCDGAHVPGAHGTPAPAPAPVVVPRCPQCGFAYGTAYHTRSIYVRGRGWRDERFCSEACGINYQMGSEG